MASTRVLFDTSVIAYWVSEESRFRLHLKKVLGDLRRKRAQKFISVVTVQELEVFARHGGGDYLDKLRAFLQAHFAQPLILDHATAKFAAQLAAITPRRQGATGAERREITDCWQRDASIAATAQQHSLDALVTANVRAFTPFMEHVSCELIGVGEA